MNPQAVSEASGSTAMRAIAWAGLLAGALDITAAFVVYGAFGARPIPLLQGIAAGLLGPRALAGGTATAALGLFLQFFIASSFAGVYYVASRRLPWLLRHTILSGTLYGAAAYFFMNRIVVPLSAAHKYPFSFKMMVIGVTIHIICVGLPIAMAVRRFSA